MDPWSLGVAVAAFLVSIVVLIVSNRTFLVAKMSYDALIAPILKVTFELDNDQRKYMLVLTNDGVNDIYDITAHNSVRRWTADGSNWFGSTSYEGKSHAHLKPGASIRFLIRNDAVAQLFGRPGEKEAQGLNPRAIIIFDIAYRRMPDRKVFETKDYLIFDRFDSGDVFPLPPYFYSPEMLKELGFPPI